MKKVVRESMVSEGQVRAVGESVVLCFAIRSFSRSE